MATPIIPCGSQGAEAAGLQESSKATNTGIASPQPRPFTGFSLFKYLLSGLGLRRFALAITHALSRKLGLFATMMLQRVSVF
jgi:hypothetical protein